MSKLDTRKIIENIYAIAKQRQIMIKDLETKADVSIGYLSKMNRPNSRLPLDVISNIAGQFGMTIDALVNYDPSGLTAQEKKIVKLFEKLVADTNADKLEWHVFLKDIYKRYFLKQEADVVEQRGLPPLSHVDSVKVKDENNQIVMRYAIRHESKFLNFKAEAKITARAINSYLADIGGGTRVFVVLTNYSYFYPECSLITYNFDGYEMYFLKDEQIVKVCQATAEEYPTYLECFEKLQLAVKNYDARGKLDKKANSIIDGYLGI